MPASSDSSLHDLVSPLHFTHSTRRSPSGWMPGPSPASGCSHVNRTALLQRDLRAEKVDSRSCGSPEEKGGYRAMDRATSLWAEVCLPSGRNCSGPLQPLHPEPAGLRLTSFLPPASPPLQTSESQADFRSFSESDFWGAELLAHPMLFLGPGLPAPTPPPGRCFWGAFLLHPNPSSVLRHWVTVTVTSHRGSVPGSPSLLRQSSGVGLHRSHHPEPGAEEPLMPAELMHCRYG